MVPKLDTSFTDKVLLAFKKINSEITIDSLEHDFSPRLAKYLIEGVLGYDGSDYTFERSRTDITLFDENKNRVVVIETKRPRENLDAESWRNQAGKYADSSTHFVGLTNGYRFILWEIKDGEKILKSDIDFKSLISLKKLSESKLSTQEVEQILFLNNITKIQIWSEAKYAIFDPYYAKIDVAEDNGFEKLIDQLNYISNDILRQYTYSSFDDYYANYAAYKQAKNEIDVIKKSNGGDKKEASRVAAYEMKIEGKYKKYSTFLGYYIWKALSNRSDDKEEENKQVFCKESIYVLINRLLFIRICEDKGLIGKRIISNGGIEKLRDLLHDESFPDPDLGVFKQIVFNFSYDRGNHLYNHFYEKNNPLDWYESGDGELDRVLNRVLWILNQFNFSKVDRDILGKIYEKYLPKEERKSLGEFYTPDEVIDYILDAVEYLPNKTIENKDLIDPACGSGGFLVRSARRLIARCAVKFDKATPKEALDNKKWQEVLNRLSPKECEEIVNTVALHIHGFDINPFAVNISEMNLLFQVIDLYFKANKANRAFVVPRFKVYGTDSLELPKEQSSITQFYDGSGKNMAKDLATIEELKKKKYDFVVGNPPYVRQEEVSNKWQLEKAFPEVYTGRADLYVYFIELGIKLLNDKGKLGYITSNKFMKTEYGVGTRKFLLSNSKIEHIIDFGDSKLFADATNYPCIFVLNSDRDYNAPIYLVNITDKAVIKSNELGEMLSLIKKQKGKIYGVDFVEMNQNSLSSDKWQMTSEEKLKIIQKIKKSGDMLYPKYSETVIIGMRTGLNDAFIVDSADGFEENLVKPVVWGKDIEPFTTKAVKFCIYPNGFEERLIPRVIRHLSGFRQELEARAQFKQRKDMKWFEIEQPVSKEIFEKPKIITPSLSERSSIMYDIDGLYCFNSCTMVVPKETKREIGYYLTAILNSKLVFFYLTTYSPYVQAKYYSFEPQYLKLIPIVDFEESDFKFKKIVELSKQLHQMLKKKPEAQEDTAIKKMKNELDDLVFKIYDITLEERKIIEAASSK